LFIWIARLCLCNVTAQGDGSPFPVLQSALLCCTAIARSPALRTSLIAAATILFLFFLTALAQDEGVLFSDGSVQHVVRAEDVPWRPCPPNLPSDCEIAMLEGDLRKTGIFTVRFRLGPNFVMPAHTHPRLERVTVLKGRLAVAFGADAARTDATQFGPGDYYVNATDAVHTVWGVAAAEIQITGQGPWEAHFVAGEGTQN
jgi:quercetin dioxygenase-like cupin family protein